MVGCDRLRLRLRIRLRSHHRFYRFLASNEKCGSQLAKARNTTQTLNQEHRTQNSKTQNSNPFPHPLTP
jgi:hypothetical protein